MINPNFYSNLKFKRFSKALLLHMYTSSIKTSSLTYIYILINLKEKVREDHM